MTSENLFKAALPVADSDALTIGSSGNPMVGTGELFTNYQRILSKIGPNLCDAPTYYDHRRSIGRWAAEGSVS